MHSHHCPTCSGNATRATRATRRRRLSCRSVTQREEEDDDGDTGGQVAVKNKKDSDGGGPRCEYERGENVTFCRFLVDVCPLTSPAVGRTVGLAPRRKVTSLRFLGFPLKKRVAADEPHRHLRFYSRNKVRFTASSRVCSCGRERTSLRWLDAGGVP